MYRRTTSNGFFFVVLLTFLVACQHSPAIPPLLQLPTLTPTPRQVAVEARHTLPPTWTPTFTYTPSNTPTFTATPTRTPTPTPTASDTPTVTPTFTPSPSNTPRPTLPPPPVVQPGQPSANPQPSGGGAAGAMAAFSAPPMVHDPNDPRVARLYAVPIIPTTSGRARQIVAVGRGMGNRANVFSKVGDCHTTAHAFFLPFGVGEFDLGPYGYLRDTINFFSVSPRESVTNSFVNDSFAASSAFNMAAVLDPTWSNPSYCQPGEAPLLCEYRVVHPAVAIIMLGSVDMQVYGAEQFRASTRQVVQETINRGIIPVLTTYPSSPNYLWEQSLDFNMILVDIAQAEQIPLINFWLASRALPGYGLEGDGFHISQPPTRFINFNGEQNQYGQTLRNLLTLQTLEVLRRDALQ